MLQFSTWQELGLYLLKHFLYVLVINLDCEGVVKECIGKGTIMRYYPSQICANASWHVCKVFIGGPTDEILAVEKLHGLDKPNTNSYSRMSIHIHLEFV